MPVIIRSYGRTLASVFPERPDLVTQYNVGLLIASQLGYGINQSPSKLPDDYEIYGNDIDGFAGRAKVEFTEDHYKYYVIP